MTKEEKIQVFEKELAQIVNPPIREFIEDAVSNLPDYFFVVAASSTGKYHPPYALGDGGLVRHTKAAVAIAKDLLGLEMYAKFSQEQKDIIIGTLILHDGLKHGLAGGVYTVAKHPILVAEWMEGSLGIHDKLNSECCAQMLGAIRSHMGQFNTDYKTHEEILPKPHAQIEKFVHQCDYLASRKYLEVNFDAIHYDGERV